MVARTNLPGMGQTLFWWRRESPDTMSHRGTNIKHFTRGSQDSFGLMDESRAGAWLWGQVLCLFWFRDTAVTETQMRIITEMLTVNELIIGASNS